MQAVWNFRSLLSIGFSLCFLPVLRKLCDTPKEKEEFFHRHIRFFNAHPYFASYALGISIRLEEMHHNGEPHMHETADRLKELLISPLGAIGDKLFWALIKPACLITGMVGIYLAPTIIFKVIALLVVFLLYNIPHFYFRYDGLIKGYNHPLDIYRYVGYDRFAKLQKTFSVLFFIMLLTLVTFFSYKISKNNIFLLIVFFFSFFYTYFFHKLTRNFYLIVLATFLFFLVAGILFI
jgi:mannose/fructose/N-acetylgalactosamine-specific phosphotransferase system component IID